jgi:hypothetical protein
VTTQQFNVSAAKRFNRRVLPARGRKPRAACAPSLATVARGCYRTWRSKNGFDFKELCRLPGPPWIPATATSQFAEGVTAVDRRRQREFNS